MSLSLSKIPHPNPEIISRHLEKEAVLVMPINGKVKVLNDVGARVWELIDGGHSIEAIIARIAEEYNAAEEVVAVDVQTFLAQLADRGMITLD